MSYARCSRHLVGQAVAMSRRKLNSLLSIVLCETTLARSAKVPRFEQLVFLRVFIPFFMLSESLFALSSPPTWRYRYIVSRLLQRRNCIVPVCFRPIIITIKKLKEIIGCII